MAVKKAKSAMSRIWNSYELTNLDKCRLAKLTQKQ
jgi:hypothetical protein